jgi:hypothetical protein
MGMERNAKSHHETAQKRAKRSKTPTKNFETLKNEVAFFVLRDDALLRAVFWPAGDREQVNLRRFYRVFCLCFVFINFR